MYLYELRLSHTISISALRCRMHRWSTQLYYEHLEMLPLTCNLLREPRKWWPIQHCSYSNRQTLRELSTLQSPVLQRLEELLVEIYAARKPEGDIDIDMSIFNSDKKGRIHVWAQLSTYFSVPSAHMRWPLFCGKLFGNVQNLKLLLC